MRVTGLELINCSFNILFSNKKAVTVVLTLNYYNSLLTNFNQNSKFKSALDIYSLSIDNDFLDIKCQYFKYNMHVSGVDYRV